MDKKWLNITLVVPLAVIAFVFFTLLVPVPCSAEEDGGTMVFIKPVRAVIFEHSLHLEQKLDCKACHPKVFAKKAGQAESSDDFTMAAFDQGKYCGACHDGKKAFSSNTRCTWCHIGVREHKRMEEDSLGLKNKQR